MQLKQFWLGYGGLHPLSFAEQSDSGTSGVDSTELSDIEGDPDTYSHHEDESLENM